MPLFDGSTSILEKFVKTRSPNVELLDIVHLLRRITSNEAFYVVGRLFGLCQRSDRTRLRRITVGIMKSPILIIHCHRTRSATFVHPLVLCPLRLARIDVPNELGRSLVR